MDTVVQGSRPSAGLGNDVIVAWYHSGADGPLRRLLRDPYRHVEEWRQTLFPIWTDRRHQTSTGATLDEFGNVVIDDAALEDNVFGAVIGTGH